MIDKGGAYQETMEMLFTAKWNIPQAAAALGKPANKEEWQAVKEAFREYCKDYPALCWKHESTL